MDCFASTFSDPDFFRNGLNLECGILAVPAAIENGFVIKSALITSTMGLVLGSLSLMPPS